MSIESKHSVHENHESAARGARTGEEISTETSFSPIKIELPLFELLSPGAKWLIVVSPSGTEMIHSEKEGVLLVTTRR